MIKIAGCEDKIKKYHKLSFEEHINMRYDEEAKEFIRDQIESGGRLSLLF